MSALEVKEVDVKFVRPLNGRGYNLTLLQLFGIGPKWTLTCGECGLSFSKRLPLVDSPGIQCPHCKTVNVIEGLTWRKI